MGSSFADTQYSANISNFNNLPKTNDVWIFTNCRVDKFQKIIHCILWGTNTFINTVYILRILLVKDSTTSVALQKVFGIAKIHLLNIQYITRYNFKKNFSST